MEGHWIIVLLIATLETMIADKGSFYLNYIPNIKHNLRVIDVEKN